MTRSQGRLTEVGFWEQTWSSGDGPAARQAADGPRWRSFADVVLWDRLMAPRLRPLLGGRVLEVGCAPGRNLVRLYQTFGLDPWGVEFTDAGVARARAALTTCAPAWGQPPPDPAHVSQADFFDDAWLDPLRGTFDAVVSFGFIEHFDDPRSVVARHVELLRPGGVLVVTLPNYRGINGILVRGLDPGILPAHNLDVMTPRAVAALAGPDLDVDHAGPYGGLDVGALSASSPARRWALRGLRGVQWGVNRALRALPAGAVPDSGWWSPYLALVGRRR